MGTLPKRSILSVWFARLPEEKAVVYDACATELESGFAQLSVALDEGMRQQELGHLRRTREAAVLCRELAERHGHLLRNVLRVLDQESRHLAALPDALPIDGASYRTAAARSKCFWDGLLRRVLFSARIRWLHKLNSLREILADTSRTFVRTAEEISCGLSLAPVGEWATLEALHDDWNTCLQETVIHLKCLLDRAAPRELEGLRRELKALEKPALQHLAAAEIERQDSHLQGRPCI